MFPQTHLLLRVIMIIEQLEGTIARHHHHCQQQWQHYSLKCSQKKT